VRKRREVSEESFFKKERKTEKIEDLTSTKKMCPEEPPPPPPPPPPASSPSSFIASMTARVQSTAPSIFVDTTRDRVRGSESAKLRKVPLSPALL